MGYRNLQECVVDLEKSGQLLRITNPVDARLQVSAIQRRVYQAHGPALLFTNVTNCKFPLLANLFGTMERTHFLFRDTLNAVRKFIDLKIDPQDALKHPFRYVSILKVLKNLRPKFVTSGPILKNETTVDKLPQHISWPRDGGAFITLPQVYTEDVTQPGFKHSNLGMYRIQISGNDYSKEQIGLHYQTHRGIGVHHTTAKKNGMPFRVNIFVGGPPAMNLAAVMPLPEGLPELYFAGALGGRRISLIQQKQGAALPLHANADFCITGTVDPQKLLPEGPFGDHLGYYSLQHDFPVLNVEKVYHRDGAIWPFTTVGRPPQEDTIFGELIHELTGPIIPTVLPGIKKVHAVDATGVHPLLLAIGSERYTPYKETKFPQELLTQANAILGQGQLSLAKYLWIANTWDNPDLDINDIPAFLKHMLQRVDWKRDLHFQTCTTIDTLDYSGNHLNQGSKVVIAAVGEPHRKLATLPPATLPLPPEFRNPKMALPGIMVITGPKYSGPHMSEVNRMENLCEVLKTADLQNIPLLVIADDSEFTSRTLHNFLWVTFTRSNPASDIYGIAAFVENKHWGAKGPLVIDARSKPHHAPVIEEDPATEKMVDELGKPGKILHGVI